jgi:hypothetical protein
MLVHKLIGLVTVSVVTNCRALQYMFVGFANVPQNYSLKKELEGPF